MNTTGIIIPSVKKWWIIHQYNVESAFFYMVISKKFIYMENHLGDESSILNKMFKKNKTNNAKRKLLVLVWKIL